VPAVNKTFLSIMMQHLDLTLSEKFIKS